LNLAKDDYPSLINETNAMDIILCRNLLMYFSEEQRKKTIKRFHDCLVDDGCLVVGITENLIPLLTAFDAVQALAKTTYRKVIKPKSTPIPEITFEEKIKHYPISKARAVQQAIRNENVIVNKLMPKPTQTKTESTPLPKIDVALLAHDYANQGQLQQALTVLNNAIAEDKLNPQLHYLLATILIELGKCDDAYHALYQVIYLDSQFILAYFTLGMLEKRRGSDARSQKNFSIVSKLLKQCQAEELLLGIENLTAGRLFEILQAMDMQSQTAR
jgi:chemotaxis protein methyltransferase CheR